MGGEFEGNKVSRFRKEDGIYVTLDVLTLVLFEAGVGLRIFPAIYFIGALIVPCFLAKDLKNHWDVRVTGLSLAFWSICAVIGIGFGKAIADSGFGESITIENSLLIVFCLQLFRLFLMRVVRYFYHYGKF